MKRFGKSAAYAFCSDNQSGFMQAFSIYLLILKYFILLKYSVLLKHHYDDP